MAQKKTTGEKKMTQREKIRLFKEMQENILNLKDEIDGFKKKAIKSQDDVINYFRTIAPIDKEAVFVLFLDAKNAVIDFDKVSEGTVTQSLLYPREIIKSCLEVGALCLIICHNHPSGNPAPSENDKKITKKLVFATASMDINVLDHVIIGSGKNEYYSFYEEGFIDRYNHEYKEIQAGL